MSKMGHRAMLDYSEAQERSWHSTRKDGHLYLDLPTIAMPDNGNRMDSERMLELGYVMYAESQHPDRDNPTRWWFVSHRMYNIVKPRIEARGFDFTSDLKYL